MRTYGTPLISGAFVAEHFPDSLGMVDLAPKMGFVAQNCPDSLGMVDLTPKMGFAGET